MCALTEDDHHGHPYGLRKFAFCIPELNNDSGRTYLHEKWKLVSITRMQEDLRYSHKRLPR